MRQGAYGSFVRSLLYFIHLKASAPPQPSPQKNATTQQGKVNRNLWILSLRLISLKVP